MSNNTVLFIGFDPAWMKLDGPPFLTAEQVQTGLDKSISQLTTSGYSVDFLGIKENDDNAANEVRCRLEAYTPECIIIGAGFRLRPEHTIKFESFINTIMEMTPRTKLAFNTAPLDAAAAVMRQFPLFIGDR